MQVRNTMTEHAEEPLVICADRRWPRGTGIGVVQEEMEARRPAGTLILDLEVAGSIGSPLSPLLLALSIIRKGGDRSIPFISWGFVPPAFINRKSLLIVHDLTHLHYYGALKRFYYNLVYRPLYRNISKIICVSEFTKSEFLAWSRLPSGKVDVVYNGCSSTFSPSGDKYDSGFTYILYPGNHRDYKNLDRLIRAFSSSGVSKDDVHLILTGPENLKLRSLSEHLNISQYLHFTGKVPAAEMPALYRGALAVAFVSLYEGFGLPIVEAMACGVPVITSRVSAMPEIAAGAALLVDPYSESEIASAIQQISIDKNLRQDLIERGLVRQQAFDWKISAEKFWSLANQVARR
jgi:glycosyltransferase involved in cell wall biosynthesis